MTMGRYGIGARVRDRDGDEGEIVAKRKGEREVSYSEWGFAIWWPKAELTAVAPASPSPEKGEVAFAVGDRVVVVDTECLRTGMQVGAVGVVTGTPDTSGYLTIDVEHPRDGIIEQYCSPKQLAHFRLEAGKTYRTRDGKKVGPMERRTNGSLEYPWAGAISGKSGYIFQEDGINYDGPDCDHDIVGPWIEPAVEPAPTSAPTTLTIEAGKFYRTRDGRKVGPAKKKWGGEGAFLVSGWNYDVDGTCSNLGGKHNLDLVAEWVETETVDTVPPWSRPEPAAIKAGDVVRVVRGNGELLVAGSEHVVKRVTRDYVYLEHGEREDGWNHNRFELVAKPSQPARLDLKLGDKVTLGNGKVATIIEVTTNGLFPFAHDCGFDRYHAVTVNGTSCLGEADMDIVGVAAPQPKFKVGDIVNWTTVRTHWQGMEIVEILNNGSVWNIRAKDEVLGIGAFSSDQLELVSQATPKPAFHVGTKVTLTATVTGNNPGDRANVQVVVDGLPPGRNSLGVSPRALSLAA